MDRLPAVPLLAKKWYSPAYMCIIDLRLSAISWILKICVLIYLIVTITQLKQYQIVEQPDGYPTFWFEARRVTRNVSEPFCDNDVYNYTYSHDPTSYWNEDNINCAELTYGEMIKVESSSAFVTTYVKQEHLLQYECPNQTYMLNPCLVDNLPEYNESLEGTAYTRNHSALEGVARGSTATVSVCQCGKSQNTFVLGADDMLFSFQHAFSTSTQMGSIDGSTNYISDDNRVHKRVRSCLRLHSSDEDCTANHEIAAEHWSKCCYRTFEPGETLSLKIGHWLRIAHHDLDTRASRNVDRDVITNLYPFRRVTGQKLHLNLFYYGDTGESEFRCVIDVTARDQWTSAGMDSVFKKYTGLSEPGRPGMNLYSQYKRGVRFEFFPQGRVSTFDFMTLLQTVISGVVFLQLVPQIVRVIANYCLPESKVYQKALCQEFSYNKYLARFAVNSALACQAFKLWDTNRDEDAEPTISLKELSDVFKGSFDADTAEKFARVIFEEVHGVGTDELRLTCEDLVKLMSTGVVSIEQLQKHATMREVLHEKSRLKNGSKVADIPAERYEDSSTCKTAAGTCQ